VTSPGRTVESIATDLGVLRRSEGIMRIAAVADGEGAVADRVNRFAAGCGWDVDIVRDVEQLPPPDHEDVLALRRYDPESLFLS
jgi:hypothetical protein